MSGNGFISPSLSFHLQDRYFYTLNPALEKGQDPGKKKQGNIVKCGLLTPHTDVLLYTGSL